MLDPEREVIPVLGDPVRAPTVSVRDTHSATMTAISIVSTSSAMAPPETRLRYSVATALASTTFSPTLQPGQEGRRVAVLRVTGRRTSSMLAVWPAVTISDGAVVIGQQQCQVGGRARGGERHRPDTEILDPLQARRVAVGVGGQHHLGAALAASRC